jgi:hypothetical protein
MNRGDRRYNDAHDIRALTQHERLHPSTVVPRAVTAEMSEPP